MKGQNPVFAAAAADTSVTIRDYIAIQVMVGLSANPELTDRTYDDMVKIAYKQADAMIKQSEVKDEQSI